jgi:hypothetical protein
MTLRSTTLISSAALFGACAGANRPANPPQPTPECVALGARVAAYPDSFQVQPPMLQGIVIPPMDHPASVEGKHFQVRMLVDASGRVVKDSTTFTPEVTPSTFRRAFAENVAGYRFHPAMVGGCAVSGIASTTIGFERPR